jgi:hypothetical protein
MTREHGGTGLGLALVKQLVEHMGGQDQPRIEVGVGSTFTVSNCLTEPGMTDSRDALVVDDNPTNRLLASALLKKLGWTVSEAESGESALVQGRCRMPSGWSCSTSACPACLARKPAHACARPRANDTYTSLPTRRTPSPRTAPAFSRRLRRLVLVKPINRQRLERTGRQL